MIHFCKFDKVPPLDNPIVINCYISPSELSDKCNIGRPVVLNNFTKNFKYTNKGGKRLIDSIKSLLGYPADIYLTYRAAALNYLIVTDSNKLASPTEVKAMTLFRDLNSEDVTHFTYDGDKLTPIDFASDQALLNWLLFNDSASSILVMNEIRNRKLDDYDFTEKDIEYFSNDFPSLINLANKHGFPVDKVTKAFSTIYKV